MARKKKRPAPWRGAFLRTLGETANARAAARAAGIDRSTPYAFALRHPAFERAWQRALRIGEARVALGEGPSAAAQPRLHRLRRLPSPANVGEELILRQTKNGAQMVKAAKGRWSAKREEAFLVALAATGCVRWAALEAEISTTTLYQRRKHYPQFRTDWDAAVESAKARLHELVVGAGIAAFDPEAAARAAEAAGAPPPTVSVDQAIAILRLRGTGPAADAGERPGRNVPEAPPIEAVRASILARLDAIEAHEKRMSGKTEGE